MSMLRNVVPLRRRLLPLLPRDHHCLTVREESITITIVHRGTSSWSRTVARDPEEALEQQVLAALSLRPRTTAGSRRTLLVVVSSPRVQVKHFTGLPMASASALRSVMAAGSARFFAMGSGVQMSTSVRRSGDGVWAAAYGRDLVDVLARVCAEAGFAETLVLPMVVALGVKGLPDVVVREGGIETIGRYDASGALVGLERRLADAIEEGDCGADGVEKGADGADELSIRAAIGASLRGHSEPLSLRVHQVISRRRAVHARVIAAAFCTLTLVTVMILPGASAHRRAQTLAGLLRERSAERSRAVRIQQQLQWADRGIIELAAFDDASALVTLLLARISRALPAYSTLVTLQVDTVSGAAVVIGPRAADLLDAFEHVAGIAGPAIIGPITPEQLPMGSSESVAAQLANQHMDRVTIKFRLTKHSGVGR